MDRALLATLGPGDEAELERFLVAHADSSLFLRENLRTAGIVDHGEPGQATYVGARVDGALVAVAALGWNCKLLVQGRVDVIGEAARAAVERSGRAIDGLLGPWAQVVAARAALGLTERRTRLDSREDLFALALDELRVPPPLADGRWSCRHPVADDSLLLAPWSVAYRAEALGETATPDDEQRALGEFEPYPWQWLLVADGKPVATSVFTARLPDAVQIGGVYTPPALRRRGYGRAVVAASLLEARAAGVQRSILFTAADNVAARSAYLALGYRLVGDYGLVLFDD